MLRIVNIVEIEACTEIRAGGTGKEIQAAVLFKDCIRQLNNAFDRGVNEDVVKPVAAEKRTQICGGIIDACGVAVDQLHAVLCGLLD